MEVRCDQCQARYRVDDTRVGPKGLAMRCGKCGNTFRLARDGTVTRSAPTKGPGIPTPGTATPLATAPSPPTKTPLSVPAPSPATPSAAGRVPLSAPPSPVRATPAATPVARDDAAVPSAPP